MFSLSLEQCLGMIVRSLLCCIETCTKCGDLLCRLQQLLLYNLLFQLLYRFEGRDSLVHSATNKGWYVILGRIPSMGNGAHKHLRSSFPLHIGIWNERFKSQCIHTRDGVYLHCKQRRSRINYAICRTIVFKNGVYKYVQGKFTIYKYTCYSWRKTSTKVGMFWMELLQDSSKTLLGGRRLLMCSGNKWLPTPWNPKAWGYAIL